MSDERDENLADDDSDHLPAGAAELGSAEAETSEGGSRSIGRRDVLKALASIPILGVFFYSFFKKKFEDDYKKSEILAELGVGEGAPAVIPEAISRPPGQRVRVGIVGFGIEGESLIRHAGFAHPDWIDDARKAREEDSRNNRLQSYLDQEDLNIAITAVCDLFDVRAERAIAASQVDLRPGGGAALPPARRYRRYTELLDSGEVDAIIIATPDHWHTRITSDAASAGVHVYCEKCFTRTEEEANTAYEAVKSSDIVFQLGHQNRQAENHIKAREIAEANILGPITLIETTTNRNDPVGAWVYDIHEKGSPETIDWDQFQETAASKVPFSLERFFRWRCWFDYGTGLSGDLLSHEYDAINQILDVGIPKSAVASGGVYFFKDGRDVPDVFQAVFEYPERDLTLVYSATLANGNRRGKMFMGHDGTMEVGAGLTIRAESNSTRYRQKIDDGIIETGRPMFTYRPGFKGIDAITSATEEYFASRGLLYTYRGGRRVSSYHLHIQEWLDVIRNGGSTSCGIERAFEEAITCHMATRAYQLGRRVEWDAESRRIVSA